MAAVYAVLSGKWSLNRGLNYIFFCLIHINQGEKYIFLSLKYIILCMIYIFQGGKYILLPKKYINFPLLQLSRAGRYATIETINKRFFLALVLASDH